jgi:hypothetical protein
MQPADRVGEAPTSMTVAVEHVERSRGRSQYDGVTRRRQGSRLTHDGCHDRVAVGTGRQNHPSGRGSSNSTHSSIVSRFDTDHGNLGGVSRKRIGDVGGVTPE